MNKDDIYHALATYHLTENLSSIQNLSATINSNGINEQKGTQHHPINGALVLANGKSLLERLANRNYFRPSQLGPEVSISTPQLFMNALKEYLVFDGAIIIDSKAETMRHVSRILPPSHQLDKFGDYVNQRIPNDFRIYGSKRQPTERELGTRTLCALEVPMLESGVESFMINQTAYGELGLGKVVRFGSKGIISEIYVAGTKNSPVAMERIYNSGPKDAPIVRPYQLPQKIIAA